MYEPKIYRGVMCNDTEELWKICQGIDSSIENWHKEFDEFFQISMCHIEGSPFYLNNLLYQQLQQNYPYQIYLYQIHHKKSDIRDLKKLTPAIPHCKMKLALLTLVM